MQYRSRRAAVLAAWAAALSLVLTACNFGDGDSKPDSHRTSVAGPQPHRSTGVIEVFPQKGTRLNVVRYTVRENANPQGHSVGYRCGTAFSPVAVDSDLSTKYHGVTIKFQSKDNPTPNTTGGVNINQQSITLSITGSTSALKAFKAPMMIIRSLTAYPHSHKRMVFMPNQSVVDVHAVQLPATLKLTTSNFVDVLPAGSDSYISQVTLCAKRTTLNV